MQGLPATINQRTRTGGIVIHSIIKNWVETYFCNRCTRPKHTTEPPAYIAQGIYYADIQEMVCLRIIELQNENGTSRQDMLSYVVSETSLSYDTADRILGGFLYRYNAVDVLNAVKYSAEYFNTTADYLLGLTDKPY